MNKKRNMMFTIIKVTILVIIACLACILIYYNVDV